VGLFVCSASSANDWTVWDLDLIRLFKQNPIALAFLTGIFVCVLSSSAVADSRAPQRTAQIFDPPVLLNPHTWLYELVTFSRFPGAPKLVIRVPCLREDTEGGRQQSCAPQQIPKGELAGLYIDQNGSVGAPPPNHRR